MAVTMNADRPRFGRIAGMLEELREALVEQGLDGWLLYDLHARNPVSSGLTGLGDMTRRWFVWLPASGEPVAITHGIEEAPWEHWRWSRRRYVSWRELEAALSELLSRTGRVAMEMSPGDAIPSLDLVPAGVVSLVQQSGPEVSSSAELITRFYARWSREGLESHRRAARTLADVAATTFRRVADRVEAGEEPAEGEVRAEVVRRLADAGCGVAADSIVAIGPNAADPHYAPGERGAPIRRGDALLLDLWGKEAEDAIVADQTWMAYLGEAVPDRLADLFSVIRDARDSAVEFIAERWGSGEAVRGYEVDDVARGVVSARGYGPSFIHRTGHSIDTDTHGMGPNIDNLETRDVRRLIAGVGFSIEPGIYLPGEVGLRTEIDVHLGPDGPEVTTPEPQSAIAPLLGAPAAHG